MSKEAMEIKFWVEYHLQDYPEIKPSTIQCLIDNNIVNYNQILRFNPRKDLKIPLPDQNQLEILLDTIKQIRKQHRKNKFTYHFQNPTAEMIKVQQRLSSLTLKNN